MAGSDLEKLLLKAATITDIIVDAEIYVLMNQTPTSGEYCGEKSHEVGITMDFIDGGVQLLFMDRVLATKEE